MFLIDTVTLSELRHAIVTLLKSSGLRGNEQPTFS